MEKELIKELDSIEKVLKKYLSNDQSPSISTIDRLRNIVDNIYDIVTLRPLEGIDINKPSVLKIDFEDLRTFLNLTFDIHEHGGYIDLDKDGFEKSVMFRGQENDTHFEVLIYDLEVRFHTHPHYSTLEGELNFVSPPSHIDLQSCIGRVVWNDSQINLLFAPEGIYIFEPVPEFSLYFQKGDTLQQKIKNKRIKIEEIDNIDSDAFNKCTENLIETWDDQYIEDAIEFYNKHAKEKGKKIEDFINGIIINIIEKVDPGDLMYNFQKQQATNFIDRFNKECKSKLFKEGKGIFPYNLKYKHWRDVKKDGLEINNVIPFEPMPGKKIDILNKHVTARAYSQKK